MPFIFFRRLFAVFRESIDTTRYSSVISGDEKKPSVCSIWCCCCDCCVPMLALGENICFVLFVFSGLVVVSAGLCCAVLWDRGFVECCCVLLLPREPLFIISARGVV
ncbi:unnamed protein product [Ectocarpus fasciculatus]